MNTASIGTRVVAGRVCSIKNEALGMCDHDVPLLNGCATCDEIVAAMPRGKNSSHAPYEFCGREADSALIERYSFNLGSALARILSTASSTSDTTALAQLRDARWFLDREITRLEKL